MKGADAHNPHPNFSDESGRRKRRSASLKGRLRLPEEKGAIPPARRETSLAETELGRLFRMGLAADKGGVFKRLGRPYDECPPTGGEPVSRGLPDGSAKEGNRPARTAEAAPSRNLRGEKGPMEAASGPSPSPRARA
jgi:hypothetical protein